MVFTHLPSNVLLMLAPLMPSLAVTVFLARDLFAQLDRPGRQSYTMAIIDPAESSAAAGILSVARTGAQAAAPALAADEYVKRDVLCIMHHALLPLARPPAVWHPNSAGRVAEGIIYPGGTGARPPI